MRITSGEKTLRPFGILFSCAALLLAASQLVADHGRFLPDAGGATVHTWGNQGGTSDPIAFDRAVRDNAKNINAGQIKFDYDTYTRPPGTTRGGAALSGGFFMNANVRLKPGYSLGWVQTVIATHTGTEAGDSWNLPDMNAGEYPDADPMDRMAPGLHASDTLLAPTYPFNTPATAPMGMVPTFGFQDFPSRSFADSNQSWLAELGLTCISNTAHLEIDGRMYREVRVIGSFLWGFNLNGLPVAMGDPGIGNVGASAPAFWSSPTGSYLATLNGFYDGMGGGGGDDGMGGMLPGVASALYRFEKNDNCFELIPEPTTGMLCLFVVGIFAYRRREAM